MTCLQAISLAYLGHAIATECLFPKSEYFCVYKKLRWLNISSHSITHLFYISQFSVSSINIKGNANQIFPKL